MSNMSRRKFLKGAGVAALAVAAAGVLAGCSDAGADDKVPGTDIPETPVTSKKVNIYFADVDNDGNGVGSVYEMSVLKDAKVVDPTLIPSDQLPEGYELADKTPAEILDNGNQTFALVSVKKTSPAQATKKRVKVTLKFTTPGDADRELIVDINDANATQVKFADIEAALYEKYDDVTVWDNTWYSDLEIADGYYNAIRSLAVARK